MATGYSTPILCNLAEFHSAGDYTLNNPGNLDTADGVGDVSWPVIGSVRNSDTARLRGFAPAESTAHFTLSTNIKVEFEHRYGGSSAPDNLRWITTLAYGITGNGYAFSVPASISYASVSRVNTIDGWGLTVAEAQQLFSNDNTYGILLRASSTAEDSTVTLYVRNIKLSFDGVIQPTRMPVIF